MRTRNSGDTRYRIDFSDLCEASYFQIVKDTPRFEEVFFDLCDQLETQPLDVNARPIDGFPGRNMLVHVTPNLAFAPSVRVLYEIDFPVVAIWNIAPRSS